MKGLILIFISVFVLVACKKKEPVPLVSVLDESKAFFDFGEGSYWVFKDSATNEIDTVKLFTRVQDEKYVEAYRHNYQKIIYQYEFRGITYVFNLIAKRIPSSLGDEFLLYNVPEPGISPVQILAALVIESPLTDTSDDFEPLLLTVSRSYNQTIQGNDYDTLVSYMTPVPAQPSYYYENRVFDEVTFTRNIGFVKLKYKDGAIYELVDYQINTTE